MQRINREEGWRAKEDRLRELLLAGLAGDNPAYETFLRELSAHLRAFLRKAARAGFANALAGAGDDGDTACKAEADGIVGRGHGCFSFSEVEDERGHWRLLGKREQLWES